MKRSQCVNNLEGDSHCEFIFADCVVHVNSSLTLCVTTMFELKPKHKFAVLKLVYFPLRARGEAIQMLLRHAKVPFVNEVIPLTEWSTLKPHVPNGTLPQLQLGHDGSLVPHARDIALRIARIGGPPLLPDDDELAQRAVECWSELHLNALPYIDDPWSNATPWGARIGAVNPLLNLVAIDEAVPLVHRYLDGAQTWLETLNARIQRSGPDGGFMGGPKAPHHGDFASFAICDNMCTLGGIEVLADAGAHLLPWYESMRALPAVAKHLDVRPQAGTGTIGKPGSLIYEHADPAAVVRAAR